jgi:stage II sporulation protein D
MILHYNVRFLYVLLISTCTSLIVAEGFKVRVLLDECQDGFSWQLTSNKGFALCDPAVSHKKVATQQTTLAIQVKNGQLHINGHKYLKENVLIIPQDGKAHFVDSVYQGNFLIAHDGKRFLLINLIDLEPYVCAVLRTESWPGWPLEVNKVFAITSRSYVMHMAMRMEKQKYLYHVKNTNAHQTYKGMHDDPVLKSAVQETKGVFLADGHKQPILAMFDICCGGIIPAHSKQFNFSEAPYLKRMSACTHCKNSQRYGWKAEYTMEELRHKLKDSIPEGKILKDIRVAKRDKAGLVQEVNLILSKDQTIALSGSKFYHLMKQRIKSLSFSIPKKGLFKGVGYGHQIGLCQWGAREMVRKHFDYQTILAFYYPGTHFMKL